MASNRYKDSSLRGEQYKHHMKRSRNRAILAMVLVFVFVLIVFSLIRWVFPKKEEALYVAEPTPSAEKTESPTPSEAPSEQEPASASASATAVATPSPTPTPIPTEKGEDYYTSENLSFTIEKVQTEELLYYVVDLHIKDMSLFKSAFSGEGNAISRNTYEKTSVLAERYQALLAINCDNSGYLSDGIIVRNGSLYRFSPSDRNMMMVFSDGSIKIEPEKNYASQEDIVSLIETQGLIHTFSFGPALIIDGKTQDDYSAFTEIGGRNPRTVFGVVEPGHYKILILDGRISESTGLRLPETEQLMVSLGCTEAYNFDGGQSTTLIYDGKLINAIAGRDSERGVTDILYFTEE